MPKSDPAFQTKTARKLSFYNKVSCGSGTGKRTFSFLERHTEATALTLVECGFYYSPTPHRADRVLCSGCGYTETINKTANVQLILRDHFSKHTQCLLSIASAHSSIRGNIHSIEHINHYWRSSYPNTLTDPLSPAAVLMRRKTFGNSFILDEKRNFRAKSINLAEAGFIHSPNDIDDDTVLCIFCGCKISDWGALDSPMAKHQSQAQMSCFFLNQYNGNLSQHERATIEPLSLEDEKFAKRKKQNTYLGVLSDLESDDSSQDQNESNEIDTSNREPDSADNDPNSIQASSHTSHRSSSRKRRGNVSGVTSATAEKNPQPSVSLDSADDIASYLTKRRRTARRIVNSSVAPDNQLKKAVSPARTNRIDKDVNGSFWDKSPEKVKGVPEEPLQSFPVDSDSDNVMLGIDSTDTSLQMIAHANNTYSKRHRKRSIPTVQSEKSFDSDSSSTSETSHYQLKTDSNIEDSLFVNTSLENETHDHLLPGSSDIGDNSAPVIAPRSSNRKFKKGLGNSKSLTKAESPINVPAQDSAVSSDPPYTPSTTTSEKGSQRGKENQDRSAKSALEDVKRPKKRVKIKRENIREAKRRNLSSDQELNPYDAQNVSSLERQIDGTGLMVDLSPAALHLPAAKIVVGHERKQPSNLAQVVSGRSVPTNTAGPERSKIPPVKSSLTTKSRAPVAAKGQKKPNIFDMSMDLDFFTPKTSTTKSRVESQTETAHSGLSSVKFSHEADFLEPKSEFTPEPQRLNLSMMLDQNVLDESDRESSIQKDILAESTMNGTSEPAATQSRVIAGSSASTAPDSDSSLIKNGVISKHSTPNLTRSAAMQSQFDDSNSSILKVDTKSKQSEPDEDSDGSDSLYETYVNDLKSIQDISLQLYSSDDKGMDGGAVQNDGRKREAEEDEGEEIREPAEMEDEAEEVEEIEGKDKELEEKNPEGEMKTEKEKDSEAEKKIAKKKDFVSGGESAEKEADGGLEESKDVPVGETSLETLKMAENELADVSGESPVDDGSMDHVSAKNAVISNDRQKRDSEENSHNREQLDKIDKTDASRQTSEISALEGDIDAPSNVEATTVEDTTKQATLSDDEPTREQSVDSKNITAEDSTSRQVYSLIEHRSPNQSVAPPADILTARNDLRLLAGQACEINDAASGSIFQGATRKKSSQIEDDSGGDETVIHHRKNTAHEDRQQRVKSSSSHRGKRRMKPLHENLASRLSLIEVETPVAQIDKNKSSSANDMKRERLELNMPSVSHSPTNDFERKKEDRPPRLPSDLGQKRFAEAEQLTKEECLLNVHDLESRTKEEFAQPEPSHQPISPQPQANSHGSHATPIKAESGRKLLGDLSEAIEASTPQTRHYPNDQKTKWTLLSTDSLKEMLDHMADASQMLESLKETPHDLHDDLGSLTNFIAEMPEHEENMTVEEWIQHTAENAYEMIREFTDQAAKICELEYDRAVAFVEALETTD